MIYIIIYDITNDTLRTKIAKFLKSKGLRRVQWSAFVGNLNSTQLKDVESGLTLLIRRNKKVEGDRRNIQIYPLTEKQFEQRIVIGDSEEEEEENVLM
jgi:CRISPR-associated protein Cas2